MNTATVRDIGSTLSTDPRVERAFPRLAESQILALEPFGRRVRIAKGEAVWTAGRVDMCMYVVVEGEMEIVEGRGGAHIVTHGPGTFSGDIDILSGRAAIVSAVAKTDLELLEVPADCVRSIVGERPDIGQIILQAFLLRRALLLESQSTGPVVIGSRYCRDTLRIREFLARNHSPFVWEDLEANPSVSAILSDLNLDEEDVPVVVLQSGEVLRAPTNADLAGALGMVRPLEDKIYDLVIVGAGPSGLAAAVYGASEGLSTLLLDSLGPGGQAGASSKIENYMGFPLGITGQELADGALLQAEKFGARIVVPGKVTHIGCHEIGGHEVEIEGVGKVECRCVILASGAQYRKLAVEGMERFEGQGIYYAATHVERVLCGESKVAVVGGGNSAGQAAIYMAENASEVLLILRSGDLRKDMSAYLARRIEGADNIRLLLNSEITAMDGAQMLERITITNRETGEERTDRVSGVFVMIGAVPQTDWLPDTVARDAKGFILTGRQVTPEVGWKPSRPPFYLETSCPGVFAVGDARSGSIKRVASGVGEGSMAVAFVHQFLAS
ncbi:MAG TPA: FAD-dependent oxidoreductase [Fimbriimonadaceae bacterium]|nr:FAD-dependent oxidoreductase [Fimbriimonadaceae bacterium]